MADVDIDFATLAKFLEPILSLLSSVLPPPIYSIVESLLTYSLALLAALFQFVYTLASSQGWDSQKFLPPLITLLMAYLALVSFYRTTGWMIRTTFWFVKWGGILAVLAAGAGYFMGNAQGGNGVGAVSGGLMSLLGNALLGLFGEEGPSSGSRSTRSSRQRAGASASNPRTPTRKQKEKERPKAWESWDKHRDWQYAADEAGRDDAARLNENVQEAVQKVAGFVQEALGVGWWETLKGAAEGSGVVGTKDESQEEAQSRRKSKQDAKGRGSSR